MKKIEIDINVDEIARWAKTHAKPVAAAALWFMSWFCVARCYDAPKDSALELFWAANAVASLALAFGIFMTYMDDLFKWF